MRLVMMRHGATPGNELHRYAGKRTDEPLSDKGRLQCLRAGVFPDVEKVYASPMRRAIETAHICFPRAQVVGVEGFEEFDFGEFEGRTAQEMAHDEQYVAWVEGGCVSRCPGGESLAEFQERTYEALVRLLQRARLDCEARMVVVAHAGTIMSALHGLGAGGGYFDYNVGNAEGYVTNVRWGERPYCARVLMPATTSSTQAATRIGASGVPLSSALTLAL